jgi:hypothetical protein
MRIFVGFVTGSEYFRDKGDEPAADPNPTAAFLMSLRRISSIREYLWGSTSPLASSGCFLGEGYKREEKKLTNRRRSVECPI